MRLLLKYFNVKEFETGRATAPVTLMKAAEGIIKGLILFIFICNFQMKWFNRFWDKNTNKVVLEFSNAK